MGFCNQSHYLWLSAKKTPRQSHLDNSARGPKEHVIFFLPKSPGRAQTRVILHPSRNAELPHWGCQAGGTVLGRQPGAGVAWGACPVPPALPWRPWLPGPTLTHLVGVLQRPPGPAQSWPAQGGVACCRPGRGQQAGQSPASFAERARQAPRVGAWVQSHRAGQTRCPDSQPRTPAPRGLCAGHWARGGRTPGPAGGGRTPPWVGLQGRGREAASALRGLRPSLSVLGTDRMQADPLAPQPGASHMYPKHRLWEAAYQWGCPMTSALPPRRQKHVFP